MKEQKKGHKIVETCPSFRRGHLPHQEDVDRLRLLSEPHVKSFDYFLEIGLPKGIKDIEPAELDVVDLTKVRANGLESVDWSEVSTVQFWIEDVKVTNPPATSAGAVDICCPLSERRIKIAGIKNSCFLAVNLRLAPPVVK